MRIVPGAAVAVATGLFGVATAAGCTDASVSAPNLALCAQPAPLLGSPDPAAPRFIVQYHDDVDAVAETSRLAGQYGFTPVYVYTAAIRGFAATLTPAVVARLRCEPSVAHIEYDAAIRID